MRTSYVIISVALLFAPQTKATVYFETWTGGMYHWSGSSYTQVMGALSPTTLMGWSSYEPNYGLRVPALVVAPSGTVYSSITVQNYFGTTITESTYSSAREVVRLAEHYSTWLAMDSEGYIYSLGTDGSIYKVSPSGSATLFGNLPGAVALTLDSANNLFVGGGNSITQISPQGVMSSHATVNGTIFSQGLDFDSGGNLLVGTSSGVERIQVGGSLSLDFTWESLPVFRQIVVDSWTYSFSPNAGNVGYGIHLDEQDAIHFGVFYVWSGSGQLWQDASILR